MKAVAFPIALHSAQPYIPHTNSFTLRTQAEKKMLEANYNKEYLPIEGLAEFRKATIDLMLGPNSKAQQEVRGSSPTTRKLQSRRKRPSMMLDAGAVHERLWGMWFWHERGVKR